MKQHTEFGGKMKFSSIPKFCISLKKSPRRIVAAHEFGRYDVDFCFFDAVDKNEVIVPELSEKLLGNDKSIAHGIFACMLSHIKLITMARDMNLPAICIFEDDVVFCDDFRERISYIEEKLYTPENGFEFDFFSLGGHFRCPDTKNVPTDDYATKTKDDFIYKIKQQGGTYAYIITDKVYDFIIRNCTYQYGMDQFYSDHVYHRFNSLAFVPFPCVSRPGKSERTASDCVYHNMGWFYQQDCIPNLVKKKLTPNIVKVERIELKQQTKAINLLDCTFITAVKLESRDREFNFLRVIQYLCDNFATNIIIKECSNFSRVVEILPFIDRKECIIHATFEKQEAGAFHRTRLLNEALIACKTDVVVNYDIDVFMEPNAYVIARNKIVNEGYDLVYPFSMGDEIQKQVSVPEHIKNNYQGENLFNPDWQKPWQSYCGHVQFFKTDSYIAGGMENEDFASYGPEDRERCERFQRLGYKVMWADACVYHLEHSRDENSSTQNPHFGANDSLMTNIRNLSQEELVEHYKNVSYLKKYIQK